MRTGQFAFTKRMAFVWWGPRTRTGFLENIGQFPSGRWKRQWFWRMRIGVKAIAKSKDEYPDSQQPAVVSKLKRPKAFRPLHLDADLLLLCQASPMAESF